MSKHIPYSRQYWQERLHLIQAFVDGKNVSYQGCNGSITMFDKDPNEYKILEPPQFRPYDITSFTPFRDCWITAKGRTEPRKVTYYDEQYVTIGSANVSYQTLLLHYEFIDELNNRQPCGVIQ